MKTNYALELYKLCCTEDNEWDTCLVEELGWVNDNEFLVWILYLWIREFMDQMKSIFGYGLFDERGFDANVQESGICFDLGDALSSYFKIGDVFPKEKYQH